MNGDFGSINIRIVIMKTEGRVVRLFGTQSDDRRCISQLLFLISPASTSSAPRI